MRGETRRQPADLKDLYARSSRRAAIGAAGASGQAKDGKRRARAQLLSPMRFLLKIIMLQLFAVALAGEHHQDQQQHHQHQQHKGRIGRRRLSKPELNPSKATGHQRQQLAKLPGGFLWRITVAGKHKMQLYAEEGRITTTAAYFSLFGIRVGTEGQHYLDTFVEVDGTRRLAPLSLRGGETTKNKPVVIVPPTKVHVRRRKDHPASENVPTPAPSLLSPPPPPPTREQLPIYLRQQPDGSYAMLLSNRSHHLGEDRGQQVINARSRPWCENSTTFLFEQIAPIEPPEHSSSKLQHRRFSTRVKRSVVHVSGRELVIVTATTLPLIDQTSLGWTWLAANGFSNIMLLVVETQTCDAALLINRNRNRSLRVHCVTPRDLSLPEAGSASAWSRQRPMVHGAHWPAAACGWHHANASDFA